MSENAHHPFLLNEEPSEDPDWPVPFPPIMKMQLHPIYHTGTNIRFSELLAAGYKFQTSIGDPWDGRELYMMHLQSQQIDKLPDTYGLTHEG